MSNDLFKRLLPCNGVCSLRLPVLLFIPILLSSTLANILTGVSLLHLSSMLIFLEFPCRLVAGVSLKLELGKLGVAKDLEPGVANILFDEDDILCNATFAWVGMQLQFKEHKKYITQVKIIIFP